MTTRTGAFRRIPFPLQHPDLRVSDAERNEVADVLAKHYGDGRLTQEEFNERVDRAMNAKTQSDLGGLLDDLPALGGAEPPRARKPRSRGGYRPLFLLALVVTLLVVAGHGLWWFFMPHWLSVLLLIAVGIYVIRAVERRARRSDGRPGLDDRSGPHDHPGLGRRP
jgi:uncharacterized membrane protein